MKHFAVNIYKWTAEFKSFLGALNQKGKEKVTVMLIPTSHDQIKTFQFSHYALFFSIALILVLITINTILILDRSTLTEEFKLLKAEKTLHDQELETYELQVKRMQANVDQLKPQISRMMYLAQNDKKKVFDLWGLGGAVLPQAEAQTNAGTDLSEKDSALALRMRKLDQDFRTTKGVIGKMNEYISTQKEVFDKLPILWPIPEGGYVSSEFGWREHPLRKRKEYHLGLDIAIYAGAPIVATAEGTVLSAGFNAELGYYVIVQHAYGFSTRYAHCSRLKAAVGQRVRRGQTIAYVGNSGLATGYHLHYEVRIGNSAVDPWPYIIRMK